MRINKHTPPNDLELKLLEKLNDQQNENYAEKLDNLDYGHYGKAVVKGLLSAAAVLAVAVAVGIFALVGREIWHRGTVAPASAPEYPNYIFIEGKLAGMAQDSEFYEHLMSKHTFTYSELLANDCFYDREGNEIKEIYINVSELKALNRDETVTVASRLKKYASGEFRNYYKFTLPVSFDAEDADIGIYSGNIDYAFSEDEIKNGELNSEHKYVTAYRLSVKPLVKFKTSLKKTEVERITKAIEYQIDPKTPAYSADIDGDGDEEKIVNAASDVTFSGNAFSYAIVFDGEEMWYLHTAYQTMQGEQIDSRELVDFVDFDLDGKFELVLTKFNESNENVDVYSARQGGADKVFSVYTKAEQTGLTIREFAARVSNMALGTAYDPEYPSDEVCEWYMRFYETENMNLDKVMSYNKIYFGVEGFAKMYNIELDGWDKETIWEPIAELYDPTVPATRDKAEELLAKAKTAFENSKLVINLSYNDVKSIEIYNAISHKDVTITDQNRIKQLIEFLNKTPIEKAESIPGLPTADINRITVKDADGNSLFGCMYEADTFYIRGCKYTLENNYFESILDIQ